MRSYWDAKARENAMYYIHSQLDYAHVDEAEFWASGRDNLDRTLAPFGLEIGPGDHVVEIGCGIGRMTRAIAERAASVLAIDVSPEMIARAERALGDLGNVRFLVGNGYDLSGVDDQSADVVYSFIVFQHIPDPEITCGYIRDIGRVLRPGGWTDFQVSERPEIHRRERWARRQGLKERWARATGRAPRDLLAPQWLGSALSRHQLMQSLEEGGLVFDGSVGDGSQFCVVHAHRPAGSSSTSDAT
jgi:SAM-dependent methyltransferase